jgi:hypothetical protein
VAPAAGALIAAVARSAPLVVVRSLSRSCRHLVGTRPIVRWPYVARGSSDHDAPAADSCRWSQRQRRAQPWVCQRLVTHLRHHLLSSTIHLCKSPVRLSGRIPGSKPTLAWSFSLQPLSDLSGLHTDPKFEPAASRRRRLHWLAALRRVVSQRGFMRGEEAEAYLQGSRFSVARSSAPARLGWRTVSTPRARKPDTDTGESGKRNDK